MAKVKKEMNNPKFWSVNAILKDLSKFQKEYNITEEQKTHMEILANNYMQQIEKVINKTF